MSEQASIPSAAADAVLSSSEEMPAGVPEVRGYDFNLGRDLDGMMDSFRFMGIQAMNIGKAVDEIKRMRRWRLSDDPIREDEEDSLKTLEARSKVKCKIFLAYTSNMVSCGVREVIRFLVQHRMVDVIVASAGGIEEDFMKCMSPHYVGDTALPGADLRKRGINRIGNMLVPNNNYCKFEDWLRPLLDTMLVEQREQGTKWTPSKMIRRMGKEINHPDSIYYWAYQNDIPVFCPAITDGSIGDMLFFQQYRNPGLIVDICEDIYRINNEALLAKKTGMIILGGGLVKHHTCNANLMRNGADFSVFINTGQEFDCSDSGARPDEAVSWGKIRLEAKPVKVRRCRGRVCAKKDAPPVLGNSLRSLTPLFLSSLAACLLFLRCTAMHPSPFPSSYRRRSRRTSPALSQTSQRACASSRTTRQGRTTDCARWRTRDAQRRSLRQSGSR